MARDSHFLPSEKLIKIVNRKIDAETVKGIQLFSEKIISDIINRSALLAKHMDTDIIDFPEISNVIEKNFDYTFGLREILREKNRPTDEHVARMAELSRQK